MAEEKQGFEFVDRRRVRADGGAPAEAGAEARAPREEEAEAPEGKGEPRVPPADEGGGQTTGEQPPPSPDEFDAGGGPEIGIPDVDVYGLLASFIGMLNGFAWQKMGLMANPATGQIETDFPQAKTAIDTMQFMVEQIEPKLPEAEVREIRRVMMDLRVNFVRRSSGGG